MKICSWNVNGIRSVFKTTFRDWLKKSNPDILCLQEIKADVRELADECTEIDGYWAYFNSSQVKKGHAGVAVYTKLKPLKVETVLGIPRFDEEGRCLKLTFKDFILFNFYIPNGARDQRDIPYKLDVYRQLFEVLKPLAVQDVILTGDFNIAHREIDVFNAKTNQNNTMFTPAERQQIETLLGMGYVDVFREKYPDKKAYTWWPYMNDLRERDIGWRIDYFFVSKPAQSLVEDAATQREAMGSDHCPISLILNKEVPEEELPFYKKAKQANLFE